MHIEDITRDSDNKFPAYAWPGGYTIYYLTHDNDILCADCASVNDVEYPDDKLEYAETYDEGPPIYCVECNKELASSYGNPDIEEEGE